MLAHCRIAPSLEVAIGELPSSYVALGVGENPQAPAALGSSIMGMYRLLPQILKARRLWVSPYAMRGVNFSSQELTPPTHLAAWVRALLCTSICHGRVTPVAPLSLRECLLLGLHIPTPLFPQRKHGALGCCGLFLEWMNGLPVHRLSEIYAAGPASASLFCCTSSWKGLQASGVKPAGFSQSEQQVEAGEGLPKPWRQAFRLTLSEERLSKMVLRNQRAKGQVVGTPKYAFPFLVTACPPV